MVLGGTYFHRTRPREVIVIPRLKNETWGTRFLWWVEFAKSNRKSLTAFGMTRVLLGG